MYTAAALLDLHARTHRNLGTLFEFARGFDAADLERPVAGFGYPTVRAQIEHIVGAEEYWVGVLDGRMLVDADGNPLRTLTTLESVADWRRDVMATTVAYLRRSSDEQLNASRELVTWGGRRRELVPALVIRRTLTHVYHHAGQLMAMSRLLGKEPVEINFPLDAAT